MKKFFHSFFIKKPHQTDWEDLSSEKIERLSNDVLKKYKKTFADLARYDRSEIGVHELSH